MENNCKSPGCAQSGLLQCLFGGKAFSLWRGVSPLRRRPKGFPIALWKPSGPFAAGWMHLAGEGGTLAFLFPGGFRLRGGDQRAFRSPFGNLRVPLLRGGCILNRFLGDSKGRGNPCFFVSRRVSPLRRRPKGFPIALWKPSGSLCCKMDASFIDFWGMAGEGGTLAPATSAMRRSS